MGFVCLNKSTWKNADNIPRVRIFKGLRLKRSLWWMYFSVREACSMKVQLRVFVQQWALDWTVFSDAEDFFLLCESFHGTKSLL